MSVRVQSGTTLAFDKSRQESVALNLLKLGVLSPYDGYSLLHMDNPKKLYTNFMEWKSDPSKLAEDLAVDSADANAVVDWTELMAGRTPDNRKDPTKEYIEELRKLLIGDDFMQAKPKIQSNIIKFVNKAVDTQQLRDELDEMSAQPEEPKPLPQQVLATGVPQIQPMQPIMGQPMPGQPPMPPQLPPQPGSPMQGILQQPQLPPSPVPGVPPTVGQTQPGELPQGGMPLGGGQPTVNLTNPSQLPPI